MKPFDQYEEGFNDAIKHMRLHMERLELKLEKCMELSLLMNLMFNWKNTYDVLQNVRFTHEILEKVKTKFYLTRRYGEYF